MPFKTTLIYYHAHTVYPKNLTVILNKMTLHSHYQLGHVWIHVKNGSIVSLENKIIFFTCLDTLKSMSKHLTLHENSVWRTKSIF